MGEQLLADEPKTRLAPAGPEDVWTSARRVPRGWALGGLTLLVCVIAAGATVHVGRGLWFVPEDAVLAFFAALESREAADLPPVARSDLLRGAYEAPADPVIEQVAHTGAGAAKVTVSYTLAGQVWQTQVSVSRTRYWGAWTVAAPVSELSVTWPRGSEGLSATIEGTTVGDQVELLPGVYTLGVAEHATLEAVAPVRVLVSGTEPSITAMPAVRPRADLIPRLTALTTSYLDTCVTAASADATSVPGCPLRIPGLGLPWPEDVSWTIESYPVVALAIGELQPLEVVTTTLGVAVVSYRQGDARRSEKVVIDLGGWVELEAGRMVWHRNNLDETGE